MYAAPGRFALRGTGWSVRRPATPGERLWRLLRRRRRLAAALLLCAAAAVAVQQLTPAPPTTVPVMVAARDLPAGHTLGQADLTPAAVSPSMVPAGSLPAPAADSTRAAHSAPAAPAADGASDRADGGPPGSTSGGQIGRPVPGWVGSRLSGPVRRGEVLTDAALLGDGLLVGAAAGSQAVPVRLTDPTTVQLLHQGQLVDVVLSTSKGLDGPVQNEVLARSVAVLWTPALAAPNGGLLPAQDAEGLVVVAATQEQTVLLAGASARGKIFLVLVK
ncbi:hypothetical protein B5P43_18695 [Bacillus sp. SRB_336]|nr:hypothetical protein B5P43_18695 [Bacillus sp. SRB_336]